MVLGIAPRLRLTRKPLGMIAEQRSVGVEHVPPVFAVAVPLDLEPDETRLG